MTSSQPSGVLEDADCFNYGAGGERLRGHFMAGGDGGSTSIVFRVEMRMHRILGTVSVLQVVKDPPA